MRYQESIIHGSVKCMAQLLLTQMIPIIICQVVSNLCRIFFALEIRRRLLLHILNTSVLNRPSDISTVLQLQVIDYVQVQARVDRYEMMLIGDDKVGS